LVINKIMSVKTNENEMYTNMKCIQLSLKEFVFNFLEVLKF